MNLQEVLSKKSYCYTIMRDNVTVTLSTKNNNLINNNNNNNKINNFNNKNKVNVTVTISCVLLLHYLFRVEARVYEW